MTSKTAENLTSGAKRRPGRLMALLTALVLVAASCGGTGDDAAQVRAQPADESAETATTDAATNESDNNQGAVGETSESDSPAPASSDADMIVQYYTVPYVPPVVVPDISVLSETGSVIEGALVDAGAVGVDVVSTECAAGDDLVYHGSEGSTSFFEFESDGDGGVGGILDSIDDLSVEELAELDPADLDIGDPSNGLTTVNANPDGSGSYLLVDANGDTLKIDVDSDGSGQYLKTEGNELVQIDVNGDGTGSYLEAYDNGASALNIRIESDGSGTRTIASSESSEVVVNGDGTGRYTVAASDNSYELVVNPDGSRKYTEAGGSVGAVELVINADGSGNYTSAVANKTAKIVVDSDGNGTYTYGGPEGLIDTTFTTDIGILDPRVLVVSAEPTFVVSGTFPPLEKLAPLQAPCATVIRLDASVLFDFDSDQLRPEADEVVSEVAEALIANGKSLEVHGHTDSKGDDAYNQDLSERRAASFAAALKEKGVSSDITTIGFGESNPVAPNETADGSDDPAGRQLNRRIEIVISE